MRFVFIIAELGRNGPSGSRLRLAQALGARGHDVRILTFSDVFEREIPSDVRVETVDAPAARFPKSHFQRLRLARSLRRWLSAEIEKAPLDFVSSSLTSTDRIVRLAGVRNVRHWIHIATSKLIESPGSPRKKKRRRRRFLSIYGGARIIGVSQGVLDDLRTIGIKVQEADLVYNAYDFDRIRKLAGERPADLPEGRYVVHAGRFSPAKRYDLLFEAFARTRDCRLVLMTDDNAELRAMIDRFGVRDRTVVAGFRENPFPFMANAAAMVLSSDQEGFPNVLVESLICGTPVVSTDCVAGPSEVLVGDYRRWLSPTGDLDALAANLDAVLKEPYAIEPWLYERFSIETALDQLEAIARRGPPPTLGRGRLFE